MTLQTATSTAGDFVTIERKQETILLRYSSFGGSSVLNDTTTLELFLGSELEDYFRLDDTDKTKELY